MIEFVCDCGKNMKVDEKYAGRKIKCKACQTALRVPEPPPKPPPGLKKKFGGKKKMRKILYILGCLVFPPLGALIVLLHYLKQNLTCDACGFKTHVKTIERYIGFCPECKGYTFTGDLNWEKTTVFVPLIVVTFRSTTSIKHSFRGEDGWEIVLKWRKFQRR